MKFWILPLLGTLVTASVFAQTLVKPGALRVAQGVSGIATGEVLVDGKTFLSQLQFATVSNFKTLSVGSHTLSFRSPGATKSILETRFEVRSGQFVTLAMLGFSNAAKAIAFKTSSLSPAAMQDPEPVEKPEPATEAAREEAAELKVRVGQVKLSVYHLAARAPRLDVKGANGKTLVAGLSFGKIGVNRVNPPSLSLRANNAQTSKTLATLDNYKIVKGGSYSIFVFEDAGRISLKVFENRLGK